MSVAPTEWTSAQPRDLAEALDGIRTVFIAMGSIGIEGVLQRIVISAAAGIPSVEQVTRLSVLNTSANSLGINQRAHYSIDQFASSTAVPYSTIRPAIFSAALLGAAREVRASRTWTGLAGSGRMALIDHRDVAQAAVRVLSFRRHPRPHVRGQQQRRRGSPVRQLGSTRVRRSSKSESFFHYSSAGKP